MNFEIKVFIACIIGIIIISLFRKILFVPLKIFKKLIVSFIMGSVIIFFINILGGYINFGIPLNPITAFVVGLLGIPGVVLLIVIKYI